MLSAFHCNNFYRIFIRLLILIVLHEIPYDTFCKAIESQGAWNNRHGVSLLEMPHIAHTALI